MNRIEDPSWEAYPNTILEFGSIPKIAIDLRQPITVDTRQALKEIGFETTFTVLTACNPLGTIADQEENRSRTGQLEMELKALGVVMVPADGVSPDGKHREGGYAVAIPVTRAETLAKKFGQSAFFCFDGDQFWIMPALVQVEPMSLPGPLSKA